MSSSSFLLTMNYLLLYPPATMRKPKPPSRDLQTLILNELKQNRREMHRLSKLSGIPYRWLRAVAGGHIRSPNFSRMVRVATFVGIRVIWEPCQHFNKFQDPGEFIPSQIPRDG